MLLPFFSLLSSFCSSNEVALKLVLSPLGPAISNPSSKQQSQWPLWNSWMITSFPCLLFFNYTSLIRKILTTYRVCHFQIPSNFSILSPTIALPPSSYSVYHMSILCVKNCSKCFTFNNPFNLITKLWYPCSIRL